MGKEYPRALGSAAKDIPVAQFHGTRDEVVRFTWGQRRLVHSRMMSVVVFLLSLAAKVVMYVPYMVCVYRFSPSVAGHHVPTVRVRGAYEKARVTWFACPS